MTVALVLLAGGSGQRSGHAVNKVYLDLAGRPVLAWSMRTARAVAEITSHVVVARESDYATAAALTRSELPAGRARVVTGGATRHASEWAALTVLADDIRAGAIDVVILHDGARPLAPAALYRQVVRAARAHGGAVPVRPLPDAASLATDGSLVSTGESALVTVQTPQAFRAQPLLDAYERARADDFEGGDTAASMERYSPVEIACVPAPAYNLKITFADDLDAARRLVGALQIG